MIRKAITVTALTNYIKKRLETDTVIQKIIVEGEISNFSNYRSGHWYFSLKDASSQMRCVMFSSYNQRINFLPKNGDKVLVQADVSVFEARGEMQLLITAIKPSGIGDLYTKFEQLKQKLSKEGLFLEIHKKQLPKYPFRIALITGKNTAARADVLTTLARRWPVAKVKEYPVLVQGTGSAMQIIEALHNADRMQHDIILLVRGGGSIEDLWSFNDESLARTIFALQTPIITGIGHEVDFTIADFVSDLRAPTPTGAAERATPDIKDLKKQIELRQKQIIRLMKQKIEQNYKQLRNIKQRKIFTSPERLYMEKSLRLDAITQQFKQYITRNTNQFHSKLSIFQNQLLQATQKNILNQRLLLQENSTQLNHSLRTKKQFYKDILSNKILLLEAYSPLKILKRGYSITSNERGIVSEIEDVEIFDDIRIRLSNGEISASVTEIQKGENIWQKKS